MPKMRIYKEFKFDSAHWLPHVGPDHKCARMHGHTYTVEIHVEDELHPKFGWVLDYNDLRRQVERGVSSRYVLRDAGDEMQPILRRGQVLGVLACVDLKAGDATVRVARQQRACQLRGATAEFDDVLAGQRHQVGQEIQFVVDERQRFGHGGHGQVPGQGLRGAGIIARRAAIAGGLAAPRR